ncbi:hypothetical protein B296_00026408 [Ensete ventricosum]|uniref:Uncharacterized protein n=1 Tax=Ensete ventricosum TaxID=4639 RepID=A0A426XR70_ENSVE|nr:hypothetical protein B296_00026408 [Ensete ventricosum]
MSPYAGTTLAGVVALAGDSPGRRAAPCGLSAGSRPLRLGRGRYLCSQATAACWREIVYPCILDPDGEDEGGQASSSLAVSTRWISAAKLLQSDLATLAQREGGE